MSHILIFIHCYGFYFILIGYIEFQFLNKSNFYFLRLQIEIEQYVYSIIYLLKFYSVLFSFFMLSRQVFLSPRKWLFFAVNECLFHGIFRFPHCPRVWALVQIAVTIGNSIPSLFIFTICWVAGWQRSMWKPPQIIMQNGPPFIIDRSSPGGGSWGGVFQKFSIIYIPPPPPKIRVC